MTFHLFFVILYEFIKENAMTAVRYDCDTILEQLNEKAEQFPKLKSRFYELEIAYDLTHAAGNNIR